MHVCTQVQLKEVLLVVLSMYTCFTDNFVVEIFGIKLLFSARANERHDATEP